MAETLLEKAQRLGVKPAGQPVAALPNETLLQKAQRLGIKPAAAPIADPTAGASIPVVGLAATPAQIARKAVNVLGTASTDKKAQEGIDNMRKIAQQFFDMSAKETDPAKKRKLLEEGNKVSESIKKSVGVVGTNVQSKLESERVLGTPALSNDPGRAFQQVTGRGISTIASVTPALGPAGSGAMLGLGESIERNSSLPETLLRTAGYAAGGKIAGETLGFLGKTTLGKAVLNSRPAKFLGDIAERASVQPAAPGKGIYADTARGLDIAAEKIGSITDTATSPTAYLQGARNIGLGKVLNAVRPNPEAIMNRVARLTPNDARKFEQMTGESHGAYLQRTGNFGTPNKIVENESAKFINSRNEVDAAFASIPGTYKSKSLDTVLSDLGEREAQIGIPNRDTSRIIELTAKNKAEGLTMKEINETKRLYERTVKLGYQQEKNAIGIERSTRLDNALREWQFSTADKMGFENASQLNKQTQASRFIVDKLGKQLVGKTGNNSLELSDMIILSSLNPKAIAAFFAKKAFLSSRFQSGVARTFAGVPEAPITARMRPLPQYPMLEAPKAIPLPAYKGSRMPVSQQTKDAFAAQQSAIRSQNERDVFNFQREKDLKAREALMKRGARFGKIGEIPPEPTPQTSRKSLPRSKSPQIPQGKAYKATIPRKPKSVIPEKPEPVVPKVEYISKEKFISDNLRGIGEQRKGNRKMLDIMYDRKVRLGEIQPKEPKKSANLPKKK